MNSNQNVHSESRQFVADGMDAIRRGDRDRARAVMELGEAFKRKFCRPVAFKDLPPMTPAEIAASDAEWESLVERYVGKRRPGEVIGGPE